MRFSEVDKEILLGALGRIPKGQRRAIFLRFWVHYEIKRIAGNMKITWSETNQLIESGKVELKKILLADLCFSRSENKKGKEYEKLA